MVAIGCNDLIALLDGHLHADNHRLLADVKMAEAADQAHAVELSGLLLEAADQQHLAIESEQLSAVRLIGAGGCRAFAPGWCGHALPSLVTGPAAGRPRRSQPENSTPPG